MARPERFELPAFWFVAEFHLLHPTTPTNQPQRNNRERCCGVAPFWLALAALHGHFHGQWEAPCRWTQVISDEGLPGPRRKLSRAQEDAICALLRHPGRMPGNT